MCACTDGSLSYQVCDATSTSFAPCQCGAGGGDGLPCNVKAILDQNCWECHGPGGPDWGAPMTLTSAADFRKPAYTDASKTVGQLALVRVNDDADPMPESPRDRLSQADIQTLAGWINGGAPDQSCAPPTPPTGTTSPTGTGTTSPTTTGTTTSTSTSTSPTSTSTSTSTSPTSTGTVEPPPPPPGTQCYELRAHDPGVTTGYNVPNTPDLYQCFTFNKPWPQAKVHLISARPIIDNTKVIHHWILYNNTGAVAEGGSSACSGAHPDAAFTAGWAPGGDSTEMPEGVGMQVAGQGFTLEVHYNNTQGLQYDNSGAEICVTDQLRPNEAAIHWLGTESISLPAGGTTTGTCDPINTGPVTIISSSPHMHLQGRHMKTVINRAGGGQDILIDEPFDFQTQVSYPTPTVVQPGDTLTTTCTYGGPAFFGQGTNEEMCYNFVLAYPAGQLSQGFSFARQNGCTGL